MALQKNSLTINFQQGLDTKTDSKQLAPGRFLSLENSIFTKAGLLQKRNGFANLPALPEDANTLVTYGDDLMAIGTRLQLLVQASNLWVDRGSIQPVDLDVIPCVRTANSLTMTDVAVDPKGIACATFTDASGQAGFQIIDTDSGQIVAPVTFISTADSAITPGSATAPRAFLLGNYFIITYLASVPSAGTHLRYIPIPIVHPVTPGVPGDLLTSLSGLTAGYDGTTVNNILYVAASTSSAIELTALDTTFVSQGVRTISGHTASLLALTVDLPVAPNTGLPLIWLMTYAGGTATAWTLTQSLSPLAGPFTLFSGVTATEITGVAQSTFSPTRVSTLTFYWEVSNTYSFSSVRSDFVQTNTISQAGALGTAAVLRRSVGLASKAALVLGHPYVMTTYGHQADAPGVTPSLEPVYMLLDGLTGVALAKVAYSNGGGYMGTQVLPSANVNGSQISVGYLFKDQIIAVNKSQGSPNVNGVYAQLGINLATFTMGAKTTESEIAGSLHLTGGYLWQYDGALPVEHGFHVWPEDIAATWNASGAITQPANGTVGAMHSLGAQSGQPAGPSYNYQVTYEWTDAQGLIHRSAPSVPLQVVTDTGTGIVGSVVLNIPTLRLTSKVSATNPVRIVIYRWSTAQPVYYQVTPIASPLYNDPTVDSVTFTDTLADASILGNSIIYTTGGVIENIGAPAAASTTLFKSRLFLIDAEDPNLLWFSKQVIQNTPVEMSDLLTVFIPPTTGAQGSTGPSRCLAPLDDKLIIFKNNAIYYMVGIGPDNTGAQNDFQDPVFITSTVGCNNPASIVFQPAGLMFQSDKGIWLLGRDLSTQYIGAPVEAYNNAKVLSAINVPGTNQVRFTLDSGVTLMYDYFYGQWGTFKGIPGVASTIYQGKHAFINALGQALQESPGKYLDGSTPVCLAFTTSWLQLAGLQGFERAYFFYLLGQYITPHKLSIGIAYDYDPSIAQSTLILPDNFSPAFGVDSPYGAGTPFGGPSPIEQWRVFLNRQKCQSFQITVQEIYDPSFGVEAGAGLTISGINLVVGAKRQYAALKPSRSVS